MREPFTEHVTEADMHAAALQYVRKVSGFRAPAAHNAGAFNEAVDAITEATLVLLDQLEVRGAAHSGLRRDARAGPATLAVRPGERPVCRRSTTAGRGAQRGVPGGRPPGSAQRIRGFRGVAPPGQHGNP